MKSKVCGSCAKTYSKSAYYRHIHSCPYQVGTSDSTSVPLSLVAPVASVASVTPVASGATATATAAVASAASASAASSSVTDSSASVITLLQQLLKQQEEQRKELQILREERSDFKNIVLRLHQKQTEQDKIHQEVQQKVQQHDEKISELSNPIIQPIINIDLSGYRKINEDIYDGLVDQLGHSSAVTFIRDSISVNRPLELFKKLYIDNIPACSQSIAVKGNEIRYVDSQGHLVSDIDGLFLAYLIRNNIQNAILKAANDLIDDKLRTNRQDTEETDQIFQNFYTVQNYAYEINRTVTRTDIIQSLMCWIDDTNGKGAHPFFNNVSCLRAGQKYLTG